jgi:membrane protein implicated in regulation of membrane protease activity
MLSVSAAILRPLQTAAPSNPGTDLNRQAARYVGQEFTLTNPIVNGHGRLTMGGGTWLIGGPDLPSGARVRVVAVEGPRLRVIGA